MFADRQNLARARPQTRRKRAEIESSILQGNLRHHGNGTRIDPVARSFALTAIALFILLNAAWADIGGRIARVVTDPSCR
jgi:hypothetical protein